MRIVFINFSFISTYTTLMSVCHSFLTHLLKTYIRFDFYVNLGFYINFIINIESQDSSSQNLT